MAGKDISEMSFEEFFGGKRERRRREPRPAEDKPAEEKPVEDKPVDEKPAEEKPAEEKPAVDDSGFARGRPKLNVRGSDVFLFVPKYEGGKGARYEVAVQQDGRTVQLGRLKSSPLASDVASLPTEFDLLSAGVSPLGAFTVLIDGKAVYEVFAHTHMMFSAEGMPISRAEDVTVVLYPAGMHLWLTDAAVTASTEAGGLVISTVEVARGGYVRVRERPQPVPKEAAPKEEARPAAAKPKSKPAGSVRLPPAEAVASARVERSLLPLYASAPEVSVEARGADPEAFTVTVKSGGEAREVPLAEFEGVPGAVGEVSVALAASGKRVASARYFVLPGFSCSYSARGDIPDEEEVTVRIGGEERTLSIFSDEMLAPFPYEGGEVRLSWNIPAVTVDCGRGPVPVGDATVQVDDLPDSIVVSARGAAKKAVFLSGSTGKKVPITPDWEDETVRIDAAPVRAAVFESPTRSASLYITVNSCPVRRFLTVENAAGTSVSYEGGVLRIAVTGAGEYVCRVYGVDKSVQTHALSPGENAIDPGPKAMSAEVAEVRNGREVAVEPVTIREVPFLLRDMMGDVWMYVSKDKRIPLPDGLLESRSDAEVRRWHAQITRMNPELRSVSPEKTVKAFRDFQG